MEDWMVLDRRLLAALVALIVLPLGSAKAQPAPSEVKPEMMENCPGMVAGTPPRAIPAAFNLAALAGDEVRISYVGHATFLIESPQGVKIATDYNDYVKPRVIPDIATMNHAHSTHYTDNPDPAIKHVLRGWGPSPEEPARHDIQVGDVRVRNVPTNIRNYVTGSAEKHGNSIFIFEIERHAAVDRNHHRVDAADLVELLLGQGVMQMAEVGDA
jgi:hypothetical protein